MMTRLVAVQRWPVGSEGTEDRGLHGEREIGVGENHQRIFPTHLTLAFLSYAARPRIKLAADFVRTSERNSADVGMLEEFVANLAAGADDHIQARLRERPACSKI